ncbi:hypothetical protein GCM10009557_71900 [Virgisporangium ochraceum]|uniref:Uncharacterized protein n=1 Tax=Virgisporangium ochraceum TaxID=65505 RepID=A0A8J4EE84_9ACTN|nr:hypothetical protein [Virgisporangium ochraceum]GIJ71456.1 hypothetical protein Voc01_063730 [Virgisporangium ochraceum]
MDAVPTEHPSPVVRAAGLQMAAGIGEVLIDGEYGQDQVAGGHHPVVQKNGLSHRSCAHREEHRSGPSGRGDLAEHLRHDGCGQ